MPRPEDLLQPHSLYRTLDAVNLYWFLGNEIPSDTAAELLRWLESRVGEEGGYVGGFAPTAHDFEHKVYTFAGKALTGASLRHTLTEEATRVATRLCRQLGRRSELLERANESLHAHIQRVRVRYPTPRPFLLRALHGSALATTCRRRRRVSPRRA